MNRSVLSDEVTVDEAIAKGHLLVRYPALGIMFGTTALFFYLFFQGILPGWTLPAGFVLGWLYRSFMITKWRLWAFGHVRNVHELKKRAIQERLIRKDGSLFEKTEIRTARDRARLAALQAKFDREDLFHDDLTVPHETVIRYAKGKNFFQMAVMIACTGFGLYLFAATDNYLEALMVTAIGTFCGYQEFTEATNDKPQIILNDKGIRTVSTPFYAWKDIYSEKAIRERRRKHTRSYLTYGYPGGVEKLLIDDYDTDHQALNKLLTVYRGRSKNSYTSR